MAPRKPDSECYVQGTNMKWNEAIARQNGTYTPTAVEKAREAAKKLPSATQTSLTTLARFVAKKARDVLLTDKNKHDEPWVVLPEDSLDEYYLVEDEEGCETGETLDEEMMKGEDFPKDGQGK